MGMMSRTKLYFLIGGIVVGYLLCMLMLKNKGAHFNNKEAKIAKNLPLYWIDPMEPTVHYNDSGKSTMGMELVPIYAENNSTMAMSAKISPGIVQNLGVKTAIAEKKLITKTIKTLGYAQGTPVIEPSVTGAVKSLNVSVIAEIPEAESGWIQEGQLVVARLIAYPITTFQGTINGIAPEIDPTSRTLRIVVNFNEVPMAVKANAAVALMVLAQQSDPVLAVPKESIIPYGFENRVVIATNDNEFQINLVDIGLEGDEVIEVKSGLKDQDKVIVSGQFLLDSEASLKSGLSRLSQTQNVNLANNSSNTIQPDQEKQGNSLTANNMKSNLEISAKGIIESIMLDPPMVTLQHESISELKMPQTTTMFYVKENVELSKLKAGARIRFYLQKTNDGKLVIIKIEPEN